MTVIKISPPLMGHGRTVPQFFCDQPGNRCFDKNLMLERDAADSIASETVVQPRLKI